MIRSLAGIIGNAMNAVDKDLFNFVGHIGGDGFILLTRPSISVTISEKIVRLFLSSMPEFHGIRDFEKGFYTSINRKGERGEIRSLVSFDRHCKHESEQD
jgi:hypothetical protein